MSNPGGREGRGTMFETYCPRDPLESLTRHLNGRASMPMCARELTRSVSSKGFAAAACATRRMRVLPTRPGPRRPVSKEVQVEAHMKIFIDSGDIGEIKEAAQMGAIDGVTTNPTLLAKAGKPRRQAILEICEVVDGPVSAEVLSTDTEGMLKEGRELAKLHPNVVVKIPLIVE